MADQLSARERQFVDAYIAGHCSNASEAAKAAGYRDGPGLAVTASRVLSRANVQAAIAERQQQAAAVSGVTVQRVVDELCRLAFSDVRGLFSESGQLQDVRELPEDLARAVASVEVVRRQTRRTDETDVDEYLHKIKLWDKNSALEKLAKTLGMYQDGFSVNPHGRGRMVIAWQQDSPTE